MHLLPTTLLLTLLPTIIAADQIPLKDRVAGLVDNFKQYLPTGSVPNPIDAGASFIAGSKIEKINVRNYERKLGPKPDEEEEWLIYLTGGNKTCFGNCDDPDLVWNASVAILSAKPNHPNSILKFGQINCETEEVLCTALGARVPSIFHFVFPQLPSTDNSANAPLSPMREIQLNITTLETSDIVSIPRATESRYKEYTEYTGALHPVDGILAKFKLFLPLGYVLWGFGSTPSWLIMIGVSFISRQMMANRAGRRADQRATAGTAAGAAAAVGAAAVPAAAPAPAAARPAGAAKGGSKKHR